jgi:predicted porin
MAQATIYGRTDIGYGVKSAQNGDGSSNFKQTGIMDGGNAGSRIGFRGTEDLGGGMKAHFVTEQGISPTNGALFGVRTATAGAQYDGYAASTGQFDPGSAGAYSQGTNRQTYLGLEGGFGTIRVGYQYTTLYEIATLSGFTNTSEGMAGGSIAHLWGNGAAGGTRANMIQYISPKLAGAWTVAVQTGSAGGRESTEFGSTTATGTSINNSANGRSLDKQARNSLHIDYNHGPMRAAFGYTTMNGDLSGTTANSNNSANGAALVPTVGGVAGTTAGGGVSTFNVLGALTGVAQAVTTGNTTYNTTMTQLAGSYDFKVVKVGLTINNGTKTATSVPTAAPLASAMATLGTAAVGTYNFSSRAVSFAMPMGKMDLVGGFSNASLDASSGPLADWASSQVGVKYSLSKRTVVYGYTGTSTNNLVTATSTSANTGTFKTMTGTLMGIDHQF